MNESVTYNCQKLKHNGLIHNCFSRGGVIRTKREKSARPGKIFYMDELHQLFPDFGDEDENDDTFQDYSQVTNDSAQSSLQFHFS